MLIGCTILIFVHTVCVCVFVCVCDTLGSESEWVEARTWAVCSGSFFQTWQTCSPHEPQDTRDRRIWL
jgi:hypothetical protein